MKSYEESTRQLYNKIENVWPEDNRWYMYTRDKIVKFIYQNTHTCNTGTKILNAGSGGSIYDIGGTIFHVDIAENLIQHLENSYISSIEDLPFENNFFEFGICVGSVLNYCNSISAISELSRVMKKDSYIIIEYERSFSGELFGKRKYGKNICFQTYNYNGQNGHNLWLYSDKFIDQILDEYGFEIIRNEFFHSVSALYNNVFKKECENDRIFHMDHICPKFIGKLIAHNRIILCKKIKD